MTPHPNTQAEREAWQAVQDARTMIGDMSTFGPLGMDGLRNLLDRALAKGVSPQRITCQCGKPIPLGSLKPGQAWACDVCPSRVGLDASASVMLPVHAAPPFPDIETIKRDAYKQGWNDREGDLLIAMDRIAPDSAASDTGAGEQEEGSSQDPGHDQCADVGTLPALAPRVRQYLADIGVELTPDVCRVLGGARNFHISLGERWPTMTPSERAAAVVAALEAPRMDVAFYDSESRERRLAMLADIAERSGGQVIIKNPETLAVDLRELLGATASTMPETGTEKVAAQAEDEGSREALKPSVGTAADAGKGGVTSNVRGSDWDVMTDEEERYRAALVRIANLREEVAAEQPPGVADGIEMAADIAKAALQAAPSTEGVEMERNPYRNSRELVTAYYGLRVSECVSVREKLNFPRANPALSDSDNRAEDLKQAKDRGQLLDFARAVAALAAAEGGEP